jgi:hypothetical protein
MSAWLSICEGSFLLLLLLLLLLLELLLSQDSKFS